MTLMCNSCNSRCGTKDIGVFLQEDFSVEKKCEFEKPTKE